MRYCKSCLQPDTRPNTIFEEGICPACIYSDKQSKRNENELGYIDPISSFKTYIRSYLDDSKEENCILE